MDYIDCIDCSNFVNGKCEVYKERYKNNCPSKMDCEEKRKVLVAISEYAKDDTAKYQYLKKAREMKR